MVVFSIKRVDAQSDELRTPRASMRAGEPSQIPGRSSIPFGKACARIV